MHSCQLRQAPKCGRAPSRKIFPDNPIFQNQKIGKSGKFFCKIRFDRDLFSGNQGIFRPNFPKSGNFAVLFFQNLNICFRKSENSWKWWEMQEMREKILEMREIWQNFFHAGEMVGMQESPTQCRRVDSYAHDIPNTQSKFTTAKMQTIRFT